MNSPLLGAYALLAPRYIATLSGPLHTPPSMKTRFLSAIASVLLMAPAALMALTVTPATFTAGDSVVLYRGTTNPPTNATIIASIGYHQDAYIADTTNVVGNMGTAASHRNANVILGFTLPALTEAINDVTLTIRKTGANGTLEGGVDLYAFVPGASPRTLATDNGHASVHYAGVDADSNPNVRLLAKGVMSAANPNNSWVTINLTDLFKGGALADYYDANGQPTSSMIWFRLSQGGQIVATTTRILVENRLSEVANSPTLIFTTGTVEPPTIDTPPASQTVPTNANVFFSVAATGTGTLTYQWQKAGVDIPGATSATLPLTGVSAADAGNYAVVVTNAGGSVTSADAVLTVDAASARATFAAGDSVVIYRGTTNPPTSETIIASIGYHQNTYIADVTEVIGNMGSETSHRNGNVILGFNLPVLANTVNNYRLNLYKLSTTATLAGDVDLYAFAPGANPRTLAAENGHSTVHYAGAEGDPNPNVRLLAKGVMSDAIPNGTWVTIDLTALFKSGALSDFYDANGQPTTPMIWFRFSQGVWQEGLPYNGRIRIDNTSEASLSTNPTLEFLTVPVADPFESFIAQYGLDPATDGAPMANPSGDGMVNLIKFVLNLDPRVASAWTPECRIEGASSAQELVFVYSRRFDIDPVVAEVEHSTDLVNWAVAANGINGVVITTQPVDDTMDTVTVRIPMQGLPSRFARLRVSLPNPT